jgi:hypothetical protein
MEPIRPVSPILPIEPVRAIERLDPRPLAGIAPGDVYHAGHPVGRTDDPTATTRGTLVTRAYQPIGQFLSSPDEENLLRRMAELDRLAWVRETADYAQPSNYRPARGGLGGPLLPASFVG